MYTLAQAKMLIHHGIAYHFYADASQFYLVHKTPIGDVPNTIIVANSKLKACSNEMRAWLATHMVMCKDERNYGL